MTTNMENWLEGLDAKSCEVITPFLEKIPWDKIQSERTKDVIPFVIRYMFSRILDGEHQYRQYYSTGSRITPEDVIALIDIDVIAFDLDYFNTQFLPVAVKWLSNLDAHAEMTVLFSENYVFGILNQAIKTAEEKYNAEIKNESIK